MKLWMAAIAMVTACGGTAKPTEEPAPAPEPAPAVEPAPAQPEPEPAADGLDEHGCYPGATQQGAEPPQGSKVWCEKPDKTRHGRYALWFENGVKGLQGVYKDGKLEGLWVRWYENGNKQSEAYYRSGRNDGTFKRWHENGEPHTVGQYIDGDEDGTWTYYDETGNVTKTEQYRLGKLLEDSEP